MTPEQALDFIYTAFIETFGLNAENCCDPEKTGEAFQVLASALHCKNPDDPRDVWL